MRRTSSIDDDTLEDDLEKENVNGNISIGYKIGHSSANPPMLY